MNETRWSTAIHEAGHAVVSYVLGRDIMHAVLFTDKWGELFPTCSVCRTCLTYYTEHDPAKDIHAKLIQDDLRCDMAIAMAGECAQLAICGNQGLMRASSRAIVHAPKNERQKFIGGWILCVGNSIGLRVHPANHTATQ